MTIPNTEADGTTPPVEPVSPTTPPAKLPPVSTELIDHFEQWLAYHYHLAHESNDWYDNYTGHGLLPAFKTVLDLLYRQWETQHDQDWPRPKLLDPMPDDDWLDRSKHGRAIAITTEGLDDAFDNMEHAVDLLREVIIRGVPFHSHERDQRDRQLNALSDQVRYQLRPIRHTVERLRVTARTTPAPTETPAPPDRPMGGRGPSIHQPDEPSYLEQAITWAREHDGHIKPRELAQHLVSTGHRAPDQVTTTASSISGAVTTSNRFRRVQRGIYRLVSDNTT